MNAAILELRSRMRMFGHDSRRRIVIAVGMKRQGGNDALHDEHHDAKQPDEGGFVILIQKIEAPEHGVSNIPAPTIT